MSFKALQEVPHEAWCSPPSLHLLLHLSSERQAGWELENLEATSLSCMTVSFIWRWQQPRGSTKKVVSLLSLLILPYQSLTWASYQSLSPPLFFLLPHPAPHYRTICLMPNFSPSLSSLSAFLGSKKSGLGIGEGLKAGTFADRLTFNFWGLPKYHKLSGLEWHKCTILQLQRPEAQKSRPQQSHVFSADISSRGFW